jgi:hypothetical protein
MSDNSHVSDEAMEIISALDTENDLLRSRILELTRLAEEAVPAQVEAERRLDQTQDQLDQCREAIAGSRTLRATEPVRRVLAGILSALRGSSRT